MSPSTQERFFQRSYAAQLFSIAIKDYETAIYLREGVASSQIRVENFFFMAQQSIEKVLKAVLVSLERPVPLVHDLGILLAKIPASVEPPFGYEITSLSAFAAIRRYEESSLVWGPEEIADALKLCETALAWARPIIDAKASS